MSNPTDADLIEEIASLLGNEIALLDDSVNCNVQIIRILMRRPAETWRDAEMHRDLAAWHDLAARRGFAKQQERLVRRHQPRSQPYLRR